MTVADEICGRLALPTDDCPELNEMLGYLSGFAEAQERCLAIFSHPAAKCSPGVALTLVAETEVDTATAIAILNTLPGAGPLTDASHG